MASRLAVLRQKPGLLRVIMLVLSAVGIIFAAISITLHSSKEFTSLDLLLVPLVSLTTFAWTLIWSVAAICVLVFHGPYPAGVDIALDFIGWVLGWGLGIALIITPAKHWYAKFCEADWFAQYRITGFCTRARALMALEILASIFALVYGACHLFLVVSALRRVAKDRRAVQRKSLDSEVQSESVTADV